MAQDIHRTGKNEGNVMKKFKSQKEFAKWNEEMITKYGKESRYEGGTNFLVRLMTN